MTITKAILLLIIAVCDFLIGFGLWAFEGNARINPFLLCMMLLASPFIAALIMSGGSSEYVSDAGPTSTGSESEWGPVGDDRPFEPDGYTRRLM
jgi:hypothetical protein